MKAHVRVMMFVLAVASAAGGPAITGTAVAEAAKDFTYEEAEIQAVKSTPDGIVLSLNKGSVDRIFVGSTGLVYQGSSANFLADEADEKVRFEVKTLSPNSAEALILQGDVDLDDLSSNPRVVLRAKRSNVSCSRLDRVDGIAIDSCVVEKVKKWDQVIARIAGAKGVSASLIKGVIAAESGGDEDEVSPTGYKGLMQASKKASDLKGENSIASGAQNLLDKERALRIRLKSSGLNLDTMSPDAKLDAILAAYNAGQVSVHRAIEYAGKDGKLDQWAELLYFQRGVMMTGAYSAKTAFRWCLGSAPERDKTKLIAEAESKRRALIGKGLTPEQALAAGFPALTICAAKYKARFGLPYRSKITAYRRYFENTK